MRSKVLDGIAVIGALLMLLGLELLRWAEEREDARIRHREARRRSVR